MQQIDFEAMCEDPLTRNFKSITNMVDSFLGPQAPQLAYQGAQAPAYSGGQTPAYSSGQAPAYSGGQALAYSGGQALAYSSGQTPAYSSGQTSYYQPPQLSYQQYQLPPKDTEGSSPQQPQAPPQQSVAGPPSDISCDILDTGSLYNVVLDIPGIPKENITLNMNATEKSFAIRIERKLDDATKYLLHERRSGVFYKTIFMPTDANLELTEAHFENGILTVVVPKGNSNQAGTKLIKIQ